MNTRYSDCGLHPLNSLCYAFKEEEEEEKKNVVCPLYNKSGERYNVCFLIAVR